MDNDLKSICQKILNISNECYNLFFIISDVLVIDVIRIIAVLAIIW